MQGANACLHFCNGGQDWLVLCNFPLDLCVVPSFMHAKYLPCDYNTNWDLALAVEDRAGWFCVISLLDVCSSLIYACQVPACNVIIILIGIWLLGIPTTHCPFRIMHDKMIIFCIFPGHKQRVWLCAVFRMV